MSCPSLAWIPRLWTRLSNSLTLINGDHKEKTKQEDQFLLEYKMPDDVTIEILSRLPAEIVLTCRAVCKQWLLLTSSPHFTQMHLKRSTPVLLVEDRYGDLSTNRPNLYIFDDQRTKKIRDGAMRMTEREDFWSFWDDKLVASSSYGLVVLVAKHLRHVVCNLVTQEQVIVEPPTSLPWTCCGIIMNSHPPIPETIVLVFWHQIVLEDYRYEYYTYNLSTKLSKKVSTFRHRPQRAVDPVTVNDRLHWIAVSCNRADDPDATPILTCNMDVEDFQTMLNPGEECRPSLGTHLSKIDGFLSLGCQKERFIFLWVLEDYDKWSWALRYKIDLVKVTKFQIQSNNLISDMRIENGELIFNLHGVGLFGYRLRYNTARRLNKADSNLTFVAKIFSYTKSFCAIGDSSDQLVDVLGLNGDAA